MPGYYETYLHGLNQAIPMARLSEMERMNAFRQQYQAAQLQRQNQVMQNLENERTSNQRRLEQTYQENARHNQATEEQGRNATRLMILRLQQQLNQGNFQLKEDSEGNQWAYDARNNKMIPVGQGGQVSAASAPQAGAAPAAGPATTFNAPKPLPSAERSNLTNLGQSMQDVVALAKSFKPNFAGSILPQVGQLENVVGQYGPEALGLSDQANWWRQYERMSQIPERHKAYGSALTSREIPAWAKGEINPGMRPDDVVKALNIRAAIAQRSIGRALKSSSTRYNRREVEAAAGMPVPKALPQMMPDLEGLAAEGAQITGQGRPPLDQILR